MHERKKQYISRFSKIVHFINQNSPFKVYFRVIRSHLLYSDGILLQYAVFYRDEKIHEEIMRTTIANLKYLLSRFENFKNNLSQLSFLFNLAHKIERRDDKYYFILFYSFEIDRLLFDPSYLKRALEKLNINNSTTI